jgi:hypothetical protein
MFERMHDAVTVTTVATTVQYFCNDFVCKKEKLKNGFNSQQFKIAERKS